MKSGRLGLAVEERRARGAVDAAASSRTWAQETKTAKVYCQRRGVEEAGATARGGRVQQTKAQQEHPHQGRQPYLLALDLAAEVEVEIEADAGVEEAEEAGEEQERGGCARRRLGSEVGLVSFSRREVF